MPFNKLVLFSLGIIFITFNNIAINTNFYIPSSDFSHLTLFIFCHVTCKSILFQSYLSLIDVLIYTSLVTFSTVSLIPFLLFVQFILELHVSFCCSSPYVSFTFIFKYSPHSLSPLLFCTVILSLYFSVHLFFYLFFTSTLSLVSVSTLCLLSVSPLLSPVLPLISCSLLVSLSLPL